MRKLKNIENPVKNIWKSLRIMLLTERGNGEKNVKWL